HIDAEFVEPLAVVRAQFTNQVTGGRVIRSCLGNHLDDTGVSRLVRGGECNLLDAVDLGDSIPKVFHEGERIRRGDDRAGEDERAVDARTELLRYEVVTLACLVDSGERSGVRQGEAEAERATRHGAEADDNRERGEHWMVRASADPPG